MTSGSSDLGLFAQRTRLAQVLPDLSIDEAIPVWCVTSDNAEKHVAALGDTAVAWASLQGFAGQPGRVLAVPDDAGGIKAAFLGLRSESADGFGFLPAMLAMSLPKGVYRIANPDALDDPELAVTAFALARYRYTRYLQAESPEGPQLLVPEGVNRERVLGSLEAMAFGRDLINTPTFDLGPAQLEAEAKALAEAHGATFESIIDGDLLDQNFPLIHAVGDAASADRRPRLIKLQWGRDDAPKVSLVGKGVCYDTGGLDIKPNSAMKLMKKDMGGGASTLALAHWIMHAKLDMRLEVLVPAVENAISGVAFRAGDVLPSRAGLSVEIGNTDAEGRLILADALYHACESQPELLIDMATLTGAARVALGPDVLPFFTTNDELAGELQAISMVQDDPLWRLPLWSRYDDMMTSSIADLNHISKGGFAGSITAALFLQKFVAGATDWLHLDIYGWNPSPRAGRPEGGEPQAIRALFTLLEKRYAS